MTPDIRVPAFWSRRVKSSIMNVISLAHWAIVYTRSKCANSPLEKVRLKGKLEQVMNEIKIFDRITGLTGLG